MKEDIPWKMLEEKFSEEISEENDKLLNLWLVHQPENVVIYNQLKLYYDQYQRLPTHFNPDVSRAINIFDQAVQAQNSKIKHRLSVPNWMKIAAAILLLVAGYWFIQKSNKVPAVQYITIAASDTAMLQHKMPDNSIIWLKAKSKIYYAGNFNENRTIRLAGEAYFEVAPDKTHPFRVFSDKSVTTVVGTKFNIRSWLTNPNIEITVNEGKVVFGKENGNSVALEKGQRGVLSKTNDSLTVLAPEANYLSWITKEFYFENTSLNEIMQKLADVYGFQFKIPNHHLKETKLTSRFSNRPLPEIIQTLEAVTGKKFTKKDNTYIIH